MTTQDTEWSYRPLAYIEAEMEGDVFLLNARQGPVIRDPIYFIQENREGFS